VGVGGQGRHGAPPFEVVPVAPAEVVHGRLPASAVA
jgi:hypothetical protein